MDNEKYGIELELITGKFNKQVDKVKKQVNSIGKVKKLEDYSDLRKAPTSAWKQWANEGQVKRLQEYSDLSKAPVSAWKQWAEESKKVSQNIKDTTKDTKDLNNQASRLKITFNTNAIQKNIDKMTSKIKRFGLSLLGIRSMWSLISRASSAYLSQNQELANKLQSVWVNLGAILAPVIEFIVALFIKAIGYINGFIKALTGVNLLAQNTAKSVKKTTGAVKELNKALAGFDELQNLDTDTGGGTAGDLGLENFEDLEDWSNNKLKDIWKGFKKWLVGEDPKQTFIDGAKAGAKAGFDAYVSMWKLLFKGFDVFVMPSLKAIYKILSPMLDPFINRLKGMMEEARPHWENSWNKFYKFVKPNVVDPIIETFRPLGIKIYNFMVPYLNKLIDGINNTFGVFGINLKHLELLSEQTGQEISNDMKKAFNDTETGSNVMAQKVTNSLNLISGKVNTISNTPLTIKADTNGINIIQKAIEDATRSLELITGKRWGINTSIETTVGSSFNSFLNPLRNTLAKIGINLPYLATGTNYVPEDQLAMIHKGEAVIPKKFNSQEYFGGNDETNGLLRQMIDAVNNIEINPYTTIRDVGKASLSYINNKSRQLGESVVV